MSGSRRNAAVVSREYRDAPDYCAEAVKLLLKKSVSKKAAELAPLLDGPDAAKEFKHVCDATRIIPE